MEAERDPPPCREGSQGNPRPVVGAAFRLVRLPPPLALPAIADAKVTPSVHSQDFYGSVEPSGESASS